MSRPALEYIEGSTMRLTAKITNPQTEKPISGLTVELTVKDIRDTDIDASGIGITWPVSMVEGDAGEYEYVLPYNFPTSKGDRLRAHTIAIQGSTRRKAIGAIIVKEDQH